MPTHPEERPIHLSSGEVTSGIRHVSDAVDPKDAAKGKALSGPTAGLAADEGTEAVETLHQQAVRVDTELADIYEERQKNAMSYDSAMNMLHHYAGDTKTQRYGGDWVMSDEEVMRAGPQDPSKTYNQSEWEKYVEKIAGCHEREEELLARQDVLEQEWEEAGRWSRFFIVRNSNGHIHSSLNCSTCYPTTEYGWLPNLSGLNESDAVEQEGEILCSVCYPSAPVAWTSGVSKKDAAAKAEREAKKAAKKAADLAKALMPDGEPLWLPENREPLKTERSASIWLTDHYEWQIAYNRDPDRYAEDEKLVVDALSAKTGKSPEEIRSTAKAKAQKKVDKYR